VEVKIVKKDVKNITLRVKATCEVVLTVPFKINDEYVKMFLKRKQGWINKKVNFFRSKIVLQKEYVSEETFEYLGKNYRLKVIKSDKEGIELDGDYCLLFTKNEDDFLKKEKIVQNWYRENAKKVFLEIVEKYKSVVKKEIKTVRVRKMKTRWGSCNPHKGYINLNLELIKKPKESIEYVVFHELSHLIHPNHSKEFYSYISAYMPDWKRRKEIL
jgi:predicted metal-dependent hydrolase